jgi:hypothetical protein
VQVNSGELLVGYRDAVHQKTTRYVERLRPSRESSYAETTDWNLVTYRSGGGGGCFSVVVLSGGGIVT